MNKIKLLLCTFLLLNTTVGFAQIPTAFNYQGIALGTFGEPIESSIIAIKIIIRKGGTLGMIEYEETHQPMTSSTGLFDINIGRGTVLTGDLATIDWSSSAFFMGIELDINGGENFKFASVIELHAVPYAFVAHEPRGKEGPKGLSGPIGERGPKGMSGIQGAQGPQGAVGGTGATGIQGEDGPEGFGILVMTNEVPTNGEVGDMYMDDGTNRASGTLGLRYFDGTNWIDL